MNIPGTVLAAIPLKYHDGDAFWARDLGLIVRGMTSLGVDAKLVALGRRQEHPADLPLILGSLEDFQNPAWWQKMNPWGVVFTGWSASRYNGIRDALLAATPRVIEKLDTDGVRSPRTWLRKFMVENYTNHRDANEAWKRWFAPGLSAIRLLAAYTLIDRKIAGAMGRMPALAAETPIAVERISRFLRLYQDAIPKVFCVPHPVAEDYMRPDAHTMRKNRIVSVGRWNAYVKNFPMLQRVLEQFLTTHPDWEAEVVGRLPDGWQPEHWPGWRRLQNRIRFHGLKPHREVATIYQQSKIFLITSHNESFNIAAAEALCCGCSVVGPVEIASVAFFTNDASGTIACRQQPGHYLDALGAEVQAWDNGRRNPDLISQKWLDKVGATAVAKQFLSYLTGF